MEILKILQNESSLQEIHLVIAENELSDVDFFDFDERVINE